VLALTTSLSAVVGGPILRFFGKYSYGMYVFHWPLMLFMAPVYAVAAAVPPVLGSRLPSEAVFLALATALTSVVALCSWYAYERHFLALKRFFPQAHPTLDAERLAIVPTAMGASIH
jgi:peptidoglycan/LPS O-acetylase OafA/YrhL